MIDVISSKFSISNDKPRKLVFLSGATIFLLLASTFLFLAPLVNAQTTEQRTLLYEDEFEGSIATFWNEQHGTNTLSTSNAHTGDTSLLLNGEEGGLVYNFPNTITGQKWDFEAWFYDNMSSSSRTFALAIGGSSIFGVLISNGGDFDKFYATVVKESVPFHEQRVGIMQQLPANQKI
jgi:hypothetical protein